MTEFSTFMCVWSTCQMIASNHGELEIEMHNGATVVNMSERPCGLERGQTGKDFGTRDQKKRRPHGYRDNDGNLARGADGTYVPDG